MPAMIGSPFTSLRGWLWLLLLCLTLGPTPVADPSSFRTHNPTHVQNGIGPTPTGTPTTRVPLPPSASLDGHPIPPPLSYSPRVSVCWDGRCKAVANPRVAAELAHYVKCQE